MAFADEDLAEIQARSEETIGNGIGFYGRYQDGCHTHEDIDLHYQDMEGIHLDQSRLNEEQIARLSRLLSMAHKGRAIIIIGNDDGEIIDFEIGGAMPSLIQ